MKKNILEPLFIIRFVVFLKIFLIVLPVSGDFHLAVKDCNSMMADYDLLGIGGSDVLQPSSKLFGTLGSHSSADQCGEFCDDMEDEFAEPFGKNVLMTGDEEGSLSKIISRFVIQQKTGGLFEKKVGDYHKKPRSKKHIRDVGRDFLVLIVSGLVVNLRKMLSQIKKLSFSFWSE